MGLFFALFVVKFQSDEFIIGTALNIFAGGLTVFLLRTLFQVKGTFQGTPDRPVVGLPQVDLGFLKQIPFLGDVLDGSSLFIFLTWGLVALMWAFVYRTPWGFWIRAAGEEPGTLRTAGISVCASWSATLRRFLRPGRGPAGPGQCDHVCRGHE